MKSKLNGVNSQTIIGDSNRNDTVGFIYINRYLNNNSLYYEYTDGVSRQTPSYPNLFQDLDNQWIHIVVVCDYTNKVWRVYRNGIQFGLTKNLTNPVFPITNRVKYIGANDTDSQRLTDGSLDEVRIYNRGLSADEVYQHYLGNYADDTGLQLCYKMNEGTGTTVNDSSGFNRHGTMNGDTSWEDFPVMIKGISSIT